MTKLIGQSLGRYHILEQLGEGGMATVYRAYDTRLERDVAIKVIRRDAFPPNQLERILKRFEREAKALAKLSHLHIIKVIDYGEHEGAPYLVMEYMSGGTLKDHLGKPIPWQEAVRILIPIAEALEYAHEQRIIHRDIKPSNILLTQKDQPMLTDFGIAKILEAEESATLTGPGIGVGTPEYMAPEQWTGQSTAQSDIYSLGVVLYEMLTGRKPYTADTPAAILLKQANESLPRPKQFVSDLPQMVENILIKVLAKNSNDRYVDMSTFGNALRGLLDGTIGNPKTQQSKPVLIFDQVNRARDFWIKLRPILRPALISASLLLLAAVVVITASFLARPSSVTLPPALRADISSTSTPVASATSDPCTPDNVAILTDQINDLMLRFEDASARASNTPVSELNPVIAELQAIRREADGQITPPCLSVLKDYQVSHMVTTIDILIAFQGGENVDVLNEKIALARDYHDQYTTELARLSADTQTATAFPLSKNIITESRWYSPIEGTYIEFREDGGYAYSSFPNNVSGEGGTSVEGLYEITSDNKLKINGPHIFNVSESIFEVRSEKEKLTLDGLELYPISADFNRLEIAENINYDRAYLGYWENKDANTRSIPALYAFLNEQGLLQVHAWGACSPDWCDWGTAGAVAADQFLYVFWDQGFSRTHMILVLIDPNQLRIQIVTHFTDNSGRSDFSTSAVYQKTLNSTATPGQ